MTEVAKQPETVDDDWQPCQPPEVTEPAAAADTQACRATADIAMVKSLRLLAHQRALRNGHKLRNPELEALWQTYVDRLGELLDELHRVPVLEVDA